MSVFRLMWMEIWHRKLSFVIAMLTIAVMVSAAICSLNLIKAHQLRTQARVEALDNEIRKITKAMGFNINVLPKEINLADFYATDFAQETMPYDYVQRLADSPIIKSIRHLRPALIAKVDWPEKQRKVVLMGVAGVVPLTHVSNPKKPLADPIQSGTVNLGAELGQQLGLKDGDQVEFQGHQLTIKKIYGPRRNYDDITVWVDLPLAQEILQKPDQINLIQALECNCATIDRLAEIQGEISQVLGADVQVIELTTKAIARAKAREGVRLEGERTLARMQNRTLLQLVTMTVAGILLLGMLAMSNVRDRRPEIGILRAIGASTGDIIKLFLSKSLVIGVLGSVCGVILGIVASQVLDQSTLADEMPIPWQNTVDTATIIVALVLTPLLSALASWWPAIRAATDDPAVVLTAE